MSRILWIAFITFAILNNCCIAQKPVTLAESIDIAIRNNIEVARQALSTDAAEVAYKQAKTNRLPSVNANISHGINRGRSIDPVTNNYVNQRINYASYGVGSNIILFNGLTLQSAVKQNGFAYDASKMELQQAKDNITLAVMLAYLSVLSNEDQVALAMKQEGVVKIQIDRLEKLNQEGAINPPQLYDMKGQLKEAELSRVTAQSAVATSKLMLTQLMTIPYDESMQLEKLAEAELFQKYSSTPKEIYLRASGQFAMVKAFELRAKSAEAGVKLAKGTLYPTLAFNGNVNTNYSSVASQQILTNITEQTSDNYVLVNGNKQPVIVPVQNYAIQKISYGKQLNHNIFSNFGLGLRVPIFNSFAARNRIKLATIALKYASIESENAKIQLRQDIEEAYVNMNNAWERFTILGEQVVAYGESFRAAEVRFNAGVGTTIDYMIAKDNLDRASLNLVSAKYDYLLRKKILEYYDNPHR